MTHTQNQSTNYMQLKLLILHVSVTSIVVESTNRMTSTYLSRFIGSTWILYTSDSTSDTICFIC